MISPPKFSLRLDERHARIKDQLATSRKTDAETMAANAKADESQVSARKARLETLRLVGISLLAAYGLSAVFAYLFSINFYPGGLTAGDTIFFCFVALSLGFAGLIASGAGVLGVLPFLRPKRRAKVKQRSDWIARMRSRLSHRSLIAKPAAKRSACNKRWLELYLNILVGWRMLPWARRRRTFLLIGAMPYFCAALLWVNYELAENDKASWLYRLSSDQWVILLCIWYGLFWFSSWALLARGWIAKKADAVFVSFACAAAHMGFLLALTSDTARWGIVGCVMGGFALALGISLLDPSRRKKFGRKSDGGGRTTAGVLLVVAAIVVPAFFFVMAPAKGLQNGLARFVFGSLGVRVEGAMLILGDAEAAKIRLSSETQGISAVLCKGEGGQYTLSDVSLLWHGVGTQTLLQWPASQETLGAKAHQLRMVLPAAAITVVRGAQERCFDVAGAPTFVTGKALFTDDQARKAVLARVGAAFSEAKDQGFKVSAITIVGHADPMPLPTGNTELARERAAAVASLIKADGDLGAQLTSQQTEVLVTSMGSRVGVRDCPATGSIQAQRECNEVNRRVEIRLRLTREAGKRASSA